MEIRLSEHSTGKTIYHQVYSDNFNSTLDVQEENSRFSTESYDINLTENWFEGIHITHINIQSAGVQHFSLTCDERHIGFFFCLSGKVHSYGDDLEKQLFSVNQNQFYIDSDSKKSTIFSTTAVRGILIRLTRDYYRKIVNEEAKFDLSPSLKLEMPLEVKNIIQGLEVTPFRGRAKRLFIESKVLEILVHYIHQQPVLSTSVMKEEDVAKILLAKAIVEHNIQKPYSIIELSRKAGLNDYKLKKGFKEIIGYTVFGYLNHIRMEKAYKLLYNEKKSVNEVSFLVGYKNSQHFITAFKKKFNILPGSLKRI
jgi:AraC-like DNA-binding protein